MSKWTESGIPNLKNKTYLITGANNGLGYESTRMLSKHGARVIMACRNMEKAEQAQKMLLKKNRKAQLEVVQLDLASLESIRNAAQTVREKFDTLDGLMNNAGLMAIPQRKTEDGFEMTFGVNHLGHFALTGLLLPLLIKADSAHVVTVSSLFANSKLANLIFAFELQRRLESAGYEHILSVAAHPGYSATDLQAVGPRMNGSAFKAGTMYLMNTAFAQPARLGALPQVYATVANEVNGGEYIGPDGFGEARGYPKKVKPTVKAKNKHNAERLWRRSQELTGVEYKF